MTDEIAKKKQHSTRELVAGGSIFIVGLPFVAFALIMSVVVLIATIGVPPEIRPVLVAMYGSLLAALLFFTWRVLQRSGTLMRRIRGLRQERRRTANLAERDPSRLELRESVIDTDMLPDDELRLKNRG